MRKFALVLQWRRTLWGYVSAHSTEQIKVKVNVCLCVHYFLLVRQHLH